jgi:hypothetical protein
MEAIVRVNGVEVLRGAIEYGESRETKLRRQRDEARAALMAAKRELASAMFRTAEIGLTIVKLDQRAIGYANRAEAAEERLETLVEAGQAVLRAYKDMDRRAGNEAMRALEDALP